MRAAARCWLGAGSRWLGVNSLSATTNAAQRPLVRLNSRRPIPRKIRSATLIPQPKPHAKNERSGRHCQTPPPSSGQGQKKCHRSARLGGPSQVSVRLSFLPSTPNRTAYQPPPQHRHTKSPCDVDVRSLCRRLVRELRFLRPHQHPQGHQVTASRGTHQFQSPACLIH